MSHKTKNQYFSTNDHSDLNIFGNSSICYGIQCERQNNAFSTLYHSIESLYWSAYGLVNLYVTDLEPKVLPDHSI